MIGPKGPMAVEPEGSTVDIDDSFVLSSNGLPTSGYRQRSIAYGLRLTHTFRSNPPANKLVRQAVYRMWAVRDSHLLHSNDLPTNGYPHLHRCVDGVVGPACGDVRMWYLRVSVGAGADIYGTVMLF